MKSLNQDLAAINSWCLQSHMRLNPKKTKSIVVSRSRTRAPGYGDLTLGGAELEELKSLCILEVTFASKLTFEMHLKEVVSKAARNLGVMRQAGKLFDCPRANISYLMFAVRRGCVNVSFVRATEERSVPCVCSIRFITQGTTR